MTRGFDALHIGPQKSATTWLYRCLSEHPGVSVAKTDEVHFLDIHFHRGLPWLTAQFEEDAGSRLRIDMTSSYLRSPLAPERAWAVNPDARVILCLRDPVERAFSHYWHEKKKLRFDYTFEECLENYDLFTSWVEPGLYALHASRWVQAFGRERVLMQDFAHLRRDPAAFLAEALDFLGLPLGSEPSVLNSKVNEARPPGRKRAKALRRAVERSPLGPLAVRMARALRRPQTATGRRMERLEDVDPAVIAALREIFEPDICALEELAGRALPQLRRARPHE